MTNVNIQTEHIIAYLEGKLSKEDSLAFEKQMLDSPELRKEVGDLRFICDTSQMLYLQEKIDVDNHWKNVSRTMQKNRFRQKIGRYLNPAKRNVMVVKNEMRLLKQKRNVLQI